MVKIGIRRSRSRLHGAKIGHRNPFQQDFSTTMHRILTKPGRHALWSHCVATTHLQKIRGQEHTRSGSHEVRGQGHKDILRGLAEASLSFPLGRVDFQIFKGKLKRPQSLRQLKSRCITITIPHDTACLEKR